MKSFFLMTMLAAMTTGMYAQSSESRFDSAHVEQLQEVVVQGVRAQKDAPYAIANIKKQDLQEFSKSGQELPFLFSRTPGVMAWSENGLGIGTTYMRIRGAGDSRINVTLDGVPLNSPEDQCVFWVNMNSYASLLGSVQIQRGVGTSTNGDGAFGGTIALSSAAPSQKAGGELSASYGTFNTFNVGGKFSTGLLWNHLIFDGAYHETNTDGFIHGTSGRSGSYYGGLTWIDNNFQIRYKNIGNFEKTGQAWNGVTAGDNDYSLMDGSLDDGSWSYNLPTGIKTYKDLYKAGLGQYNTLYETLRYGTNSLFSMDANGNYVTERYKMADGRYWDKATDNFWQNHNILSFAAQLNEYLTLAASLHYTHGYGYYDELRLNKKAGEKFGLDDNRRSDFVRKKGLKQDTYGAVGNVNYKRANWDIIGGFSVQQFKGNHFGYITYIKDEEFRQRYLSNGKHQYYDSDAKKFDASAYLKASYRFADYWSAFADVQYRYVNYKTDGVNDRFVKDANGKWVNQLLDINEKYNFFNPKAGLSWSKGPHHAYASVAMSHREPERNNFTDNYKYPFPKAEKLLDYEVGYNFASQTFRAGVNLYYMDYKDQLVQTGELSDIGENLTTNIKKSYRLGAEITAAWDVLPVLTLEGNAALSQNKIKDFDEYVTADWEDNGATFHYDNSTLSYSPSAILNGFVDFHYKGFKATWHTNYVSRQYLDNTENRDRSLPAYTFSDLTVSQAVKVSKVAPLSEIIFGLSVNNIFNAHYATSGWVYSAILSDTHPNENRYYQIGFIPMAGTTVMGNLTLRF